jgi:hypothetical protein
MSSYVKPLSRHQIAALRYCMNRDVTVEHLEAVYQGTLWSLLHRGYLMRTPKDRIIPTPDGIEQVMLYDREEVQYRKQPGQLSDRVQRLLRLVRIRRAG